MEAKLQEFSSSGVFSVPGKVAPDLEFLWAGAGVKVVAEWLIKIAIVSPGSGGGRRSRRVCINKFPVSGEQQFVKQSAPGSLGGVSDDLFIKALFPPRK